MTSYHLVDYLGLTGAVTVVMQLSFFAIASTCQIDTVTDFAGTMNFAILAWLCYALNGSHFHRQTLMTICVTLWALRLGFFLLRRVVKRGRDARFDKIRNNFWKFLGFWTFQIVWVWTVSLPVTLTNAATNDTPLTTWLDLAGFSMWFIGFVIEAVADYQKANLREKRDADQKRPPFNLDQGLWYYSRHPNYFGEIVMWLGLYLSSCSIYKQNAFSIGYLIGSASPILTFLLLAFVSGIPLAEASADRRYADSIEYKRYKMRTSPIVPFSPRFYELLPFSIRHIVFFEFPIYWRHFTRE